MDTCEYVQVNAPREGEPAKASWGPFLKQVLVCSALWNSLYILGLVFGAPTVIVNQMRKEANSSEAVSDEMLSWLSSVIGYISSPWTIILPILTKRYGRKIIFIMVSIITFSAFVLFYCSTTLTQLLISEIMMGATKGCQCTVTLMIITEYTSPKNRGVFSTVKSVIFSWGMWTSNFLGTFFHWKTIGVLGIVCSAFNVVTPLFWPESPYWLAEEHRFDECSKSHKWLKGTDAESNKELTQLMKSHENTKTVRYIKCNKDFLRSIFNVIIDREFYKPLLLSFIVLALIQSTGKLVFIVYAIDVIKNITANESAAYSGMLILDGVTIASMHVGSVLSKYLKRRTLMLASAVSTIVFLYLISIYLYLIKLAVFSENKYFTISLLIAYTVSINVGVSIMTLCIYSEIIPLKFQSSLFLIGGLYGDVLMATVLKLAPFSFKTFGSHGAFMSYGISSTVLVAILYKYLPETKDKTLQEISDILKYRKVPSID